jgi:hypothetical protein
VEGERELIHLLGKNERDLTSISGHDLYPTLGGVGVRSVIFYRKGIHGYKVPTKYSMKFLGVLYDCKVPPPCAPKALTNGCKLPTKVTFS